MDETGSADVTNGSTKHSKCNTKETHVAEIENSLEESVHPESRFEVDYLGVTYFVLKMK